MARTVTGLHRAVKVVARSNFELEKTFEREFEGIKRYERVSQGHPGLVDVMHVGREETADFYYYVMELGDHETGESIDAIDPLEYRPRTLASYMKVNPQMDIDTCIDLGSALAEALGHLHRAGLTHRDVKPSNVIFSNGRPQLADIGLVAATGQRTFVGTEGYVPPEGPGTSSSDLYALAMVLYEMHTGNDRLEFPELPTNHQLAPTVDRDQWRALNGVICKAGSPDPKKRFETGLGFSEALQGIRPDSPTHSSRASQGKNGKNLALFGGSILLLVIAAALVASFLLRDNAKPDGPSEPSLVEIPIATDVVTPDQLDAVDEPPVKVDPSPGDVEAVKENDETPKETSLVAKPVPKPTRLIKFDSKPSGATVWVNDKELGRTPLPFQKFDLGKIKIIYKLEGYFDRAEELTITEGEPLLQIGNLKQNLRPEHGEPWVNLFKMTFAVRPEDNKYFAPVTLYAFEAFLKSTKEPGVEFAPDGIAQVSDFHQRWRFADWVTRQDRMIGNLSENEFYVPYTIGDSPNLYLLIIEDFGTVILKSNPPGAKVTNHLNEQLGTTPMELRRRIGPYRLILTLPGYQESIEDGYLTKDVFSKTVNLIDDSSVVFGQPWTNSIGMPMLPVGEAMLVASYETRVSDFNKFLESGNINPGVFPPSFEQSESHPLVSVNLADAVQFCEWLTEYERTNQMIRSTQKYRLPTDREWSRIAGLPEEKGATPKLREIEFLNQYPWGTEWPPPSLAGNFADRAAQVNLGNYTIKNYDDTFVYTSPVGSFEKTTKGIYDLSGNAWEWVSDRYDNVSANLGVVRGGGWESYQSGVLASSYRNAVNVTTREDKYGFRFVLVEEK